MKAAFILLLVLISLLQCKPLAGPLAEKDVHELAVRIETMKPKKIEGLMHAFNTANLFTHFNATEVKLNDWISRLRPLALRFPGGTIANFYHPDGKGYGFRSREIILQEGGIATHMKKLLHEHESISDTTNFLESFIRLAIQHRCKVIYVANILNADIGEILNMLRLFRQKSIEIACVELGNELYLPAYRSLIPDVHAYLRKAQTIAREIKKEFPDLLLTVPVENIKKNPSMHSGKWNKILASASFYDAISLHVYPDFKFCLSETAGPGIAPCFLKETNHFIFSQYPSVLRELKKIFNHKPILITEWNVARPGRLANAVMLHGLFTALFFLESIRLNAETSMIDLICYHNLASAEKAYSLFTPHHLNNSLPVSVNYAVFSLFSPIAGHSFFIPSVSEGHYAEIKTYVFRNGNVYHLYIVNIGNRIVSLTEIKNEKGQPGYVLNAEAVYGIRTQHDSSGWNDFRWEERMSETKKIPAGSIMHLTVTF